MADALIHIRNRLSVPPLYVARERMVRSLTVWRQVSMHIRYQRQNREPSPFLPTVGLNNLMEQLVLMACRKPTTTY